MRDQGRFGPGFSVRAYPRVPRSRNERVGTDELDGAVLKHLDLGGALNNGLISRAPLVSQRMSIRAEQRVFGQPAIGFMDKKTLLALLAIGWQAKIGEGLGGGIVGDANL